MHKQYTVGWVNWRGNLFCCDCADRLELDTSGRNILNLPVYKDSIPHAFERCDFCKRIVNKVHVVSLPQRAVS